MKDFKRKLRYHLDNFFQKGIVSRIIILFLLLVIGSFLIGLVGILFSAGYGGLNMVWKTLTHILDPGVVGSDDILLEKPSFVIIMIIATAYGMLITSGLVGILSDWIGSYLENLQNSNSVVPFSGHTVILGFNSNIYTLIDQLAESNSNHTSLFKRCYIVVADDCDPQEMRRLVFEHIRAYKDGKHTADPIDRKHLKALRRTEIIYRKGEIYESTIFQRCSVENSKSVIINAYNDPDVIKTIVALNTYLGESDESKTEIIASLNKQYYRHAAELSSDRCNIISVHDAISRIIAHTCRQGGLSYLFTELFDFEGDEIYFEEINESGPLSPLIGKDFEYAMHYFEKAIVIGICYSTGGVLLNPLLNEADRTHKLAAGDKLILICEDDGEWGETGCIDYESRMPKTGQDSAVQSAGPFANHIQEKLVIIGANSRLNSILLEYDKYVSKGTEVVILDQDIDVFPFEEFQNIEIIKSKTVHNDFPAIARLIRQHGSFGHLLILSDERKPDAEADSDTIALLMYLSTVAKELVDYENISIVSEMKLYENQVLAESIGTTELIVGSRFINLLMCQVSENPRLLEVFNEILSDTGNEVYAIPVTESYLQQEMDFHDLTGIMAQHDYIAIGYIKVSKDHLTGEHLEGVFNPVKSEKFRLTADDRILVLAASL